MDRKNESSENDAGRLGEQGGQGQEQQGGYSGHTGGENPRPEGKGEDNDQDRRHGGYGDNNQESIDGTDVGA